ncbi:MAG TPA: 5-formyltetrahydrofolate cyclo-ligase [Nitrososphaerales archaeon]|nr:5-formyltetrahydrofolate cyclo-ligase [Nitrososphaerales archaeon]
MRGSRRGGGPTTRERKQELRAIALLKRRSMDPEELAARSSRVEVNLLSLKEYKSAAMVVSYCAKDDEVQTRPIIERALADGKRVAVILTDVPTKTLSFSEIKSFEGDLAPGTFGILEPKPGRVRPVPFAEADLVLVPLVAWDEKGHRLGYGAGYFDRALEGARRITKVGLALESQRLTRIPESRYDVPLDVIVTERRVVRPARRTA